MPLRAVEGTLREMGEKDLYLETANHKILKFRLLAKTQFRDKEGEQMRDSLIKPGDQLAVQVTGDDPETAVRVMYNRAGTQAERTSAGRPFDHDSAKTPTEADTRSAGSMEVGTNDSGSGRPAESASVNPPVSEPDSDRPTLQRKPDAASSSVTPPPPAVPSPAPSHAPAPVAANAPEPPKPEPHADAGDEIIDAALDASDKLTEGLPNFIVQQNTTRYYSTTFPAQWRVQDVVTADVVSIGGKEEYRNFQVNGKPSTRAVEKSGAWSTGEFQTVLESLLSPYSKTTFRKAKDDTLHGRASYTYNFRVLQENSNWDIYAPDGSKATPSYNGTIWIDKQTHNVMRIEEESGPMPSSFAFDKAESVVEYAFISIDGKSYPLPSHGEVLTCQRGTSGCTKNQIDFQNYRKFSADSKITFDK